MNLESKEFDIAFIGDSFTEGVGLDYKDTFVGRIENKFDKLNFKPRPRWPLDKNALFMKGKRAVEG